MITTMARTDRGPRDDNLRLQDLMKILHRRRWIAFLTLVSASTLVALVLFSRVPMYEATASLTIDVSSGSMTVSDDPNTGRVDYTSLLNTESDLLIRSSNLLKALSDSGAIHDRPYEGVSDPGALLLHRIKVTTAHDSWLIDVALRDEHPDRARRILDALITAYQRHSLDLHVRSSQGALQFLRDQAASARQHLDQARVNEQTFRTEHHIIDIDPNLNQVTRQLVDLSQQRSDLDQRLSVDQSVLDQLAFADQQSSDDARQHALLRIDSIAKNPLVLEQQTGLYDLLDKKSLLTNRYLDLHPAVIEITAQIMSKRLQLSDAIGLSRQTFEAGHQALERQSADLATRMTNGQNELNRYRADLILLQELQEETATSQKLYDDLLTRLGQEEVASRIQAGSVMAVDAAVVTPKPVNRRYLLFVAAAVMAGMALAAAMVVLVELLDRRIRGVAEAGALSQLPILGRIPFSPGLPPLGREGDCDEPWQLVESIRALRAALRLSNGSGEVAQVLAIISPMARQGKSIITSRLGLALAAAGKRVLVVDSDVRKPSLHIQLGEQNGLGLCEAINGAPVSPIATSYPRLSLMPAGALTARSSELLQEPRLRLLVEDWRKRFDHILFDTAPIGVVSDAFSVCELSDAILLVTLDGSMPRETLVDTIERLAPLSQRLVGIIVNGMRTAATPYQYVTKPFRVASAR